MVTTFLVTTFITRLPDGNLVMVDGTVPGWKPGIGDHHYDHHRPNGAEIQVDELPDRVSLNDVTFVTTQVDADACVAAAVMILGGRGAVSNDSLQKLRAIAYDCDHLAVPQSLRHLSDFAAQAVAALKEGSNGLSKALNLPVERRDWNPEQKETFCSEAFKVGTTHLVDAVKGIRPWPGQSGETKKYWERVELHTQFIKSTKLIDVYKGCLVFNAKTIEGYVDPRCWIKASVGVAHTCAVTLTQRKFSQREGYSYTLGVVPLHPQICGLDYTIKAFDALTVAELEINPTTDKWGGRATVGGSGWNTPSLLTPEQVLDIVLNNI